MIAVAATIAGGLVGTAIAGVTFVVLISRAGRTRFHGVD